MLLDFMPTANWEREWVHECVCVWERERIYKIGSWILTFSYQLHRVNQTNPTFKVLYQFKRQIIQSQAKSWITGPETTQSTANATKSKTVKAKHIYIKLYFHLITVDTSVFSTLLLQTICTALRLDNISNHKYAWIAVNVMIHTNNLEACIYSAGTQQGTFINCLWQ